MGKEGQPAVMEVSAQGDERETKTHKRLCTRDHAHTQALVTFTLRVESNSESLARHSLRLPGLLGSQSENKSTLSFFLLHTQMCSFALPLSPFLCFPLLSSRCEVRPVQRWLELYNVELLGGGRWFYEVVM